MQFRDLFFCATHFCRHLNHLGIHTSQNRDLSFRMVGGSHGKTDVEMLSLQPAKTRNCFPVATVFPVIMCALRGNSYPCFHRSVENIHPTFRPTTAATSHRISSLFVVFRDKSISSFRWRLPPTAPRVK